MAEPAYRRVIVKLSGEALAGAEGFGIHQPTVDRIAGDLVAAQRARRRARRRRRRRQYLSRRRVSERGVPRATGDAMGMLATVMNALVLEAAIERKGEPARTLSALAMPEVCELYDPRPRAQASRRTSASCCFAAGTGNPFFTTDTTAVLRAAELGGNAVFKATNVDGVYSADPKKDPKAKRYDRLTHREAIERDLKVMDATAFALARENRMPIIVFSIREPGAIDGRAARGGARDRRRRLNDLPRPIRTRRRKRATTGRVRKVEGRAMASATHDINELKRRMQGALQVLKQELGGLRTGRASASLLDPVQVEAYGTHMPLNQLATVSVPEPRLISVQVWDKSMVHAGGEGDHRRQSRAQSGDRRPGAAPAHSRAQRGPAQGTGQGRAQICRGRAGRRAPRAP